MTSSWVAQALESGSAELDPSGLRLRVPGHAPLLVDPTPHAGALLAKGELRAQAYHFISRVFARPSRRPRAIGYVRRGSVLRVKGRVSGPACRGAWYELEQGGFVCASDGFAVSYEPRAPIAQRRPALRQALPFSYGKARTDDALRFYRIPTVDEERQIELALQQNARLPEVVQQRLDGIYLLALDQEEREGERLFVRTVRGRYVRAADVEPKPGPKMRGVLLGADKALPHAFVYGRPGESAPLYRIDPEGGAPGSAGVADYHARLPVLREVTVDGRAYVVGPDHVALPRERVRIAREVDRPDGVPPGRKWIHVDLTEQVLVAYEGDRAVFATLVSSGKGEEHATPTGLFRISEKHISTTMRGEDPEEGVYEVQQVPWTLFYHDDYAIHGAYWHDEFGMTRSHGCTNVSPIDARWLFYWSDGEVPAGWIARRYLKGTYVYVTGAADV